MKTIERRLEQLEQKKDVELLGGLEIIYVSSKEHVDHPERFRKVLERDEPSESGITIKQYRLERINEDD